MSINPVQVELRTWSLSFELRVDLRAKKGASNVGFWLVKLAGSPIEGSRPALDHWTLDRRMAVTKVVTSVSNTDRAIMLSCWIILH